MSPTVSLPWRLVTGDNCQSVYILDAEDDICLRVHRTNIEIAKHIVNCVNAFKGYTPFRLATMIADGFTVEKSYTADCLLNGICAHPGDTSAQCAMTDSEGGTCD